MLLNEANNNNVNVYEDYHFDSNRIKGLYCDGNIALNKELDNTAKRACVLAEELAHHNITCSNIINYKDLNSSREEQKARLKAYNRLIGLSGIIKCFENHCSNRNEMAEHLNVTEEFLHEALECYTQKYSPYVEFDNYVICFTPNLSVMKII